MRWLTSLVRSGRILGVPIVMLTFSVSAATGAIFKEGSDTKTTVSASDDGVSQVTIETIGQGYIHHIRTATGDTVRSLAPGGIEPAGGSIANPLDMEQLPFAYFRTTSTGTTIINYLESTIFGTAQSQTWYDPTPSLNFDGDEQLLVEDNLNFNGFYRPSSHPQLELESFTDVFGEVTFSSTIPITHFGVPVSGVLLAGPPGMTFRTPPNLPMNTLASQFFPESFSAFSFVPPLRPDFNFDGFVNGVDVDLLVMEIVSGPGDPLFDLNGDGTVDRLDLGEWLDEAGQINIGAPYLVGDADLNGNVDGSDFGAWNSNKFTRLPAWTAGDFDANGNIDGSDFGLWNSNKFRSSLPVVVPEPLLCWGWFVIVAALAGRHARAGR